MAEKPLVFLSYAREDRARVAEVYDRLKAEGFNPWIDMRDIVPGQSWSNAIAQAIQVANFILVFISRNAVEKMGYVQVEQRAALSKFSELPTGATFLIPVRLDDTVPPESLRYMQFVDLFEDSGWKQLLSILKRGMEKGRIATQPIQSLREEIRRGEQQRSKYPHVFVAMPFAIEMEDVYYYGIQRSIDANGFKPFRIDKSVFTGDILEQVRRGIDASVAAVCELTGLNPNVHLELGYAWGKNIPCVLLLKEGSELCFDVRGQRCLVYRTIMDLETTLTEELRRLKESGSISSSSDGLKSARIKQRRH